MKITPTLARARELCNGHTMIPIAMEIYADMTTSIGVLNALRKHSKNCFLLESVKTGDSWSRYSFLGYEPEQVISASEGSLHAPGPLAAAISEEAPVDAIRKLLSMYKSPSIEGLPPFTGGLVGYFSYEFASYFEPALKLQSKNPENFDEFRLMLIQKVIAFDHFKQKIYLIVNVPTADLEQSYMEGVAALKDMERMVMENTPLGTSENNRVGTFSPAFTKQQYCNIVEKAKHYIHEGDIFQCVPSNRFKASFEGDLFQTYRELRTINPSPYMVYMSIGDTEIACASPETLVSLRDGIVHTYPLAGTCGRGKTLQEDEALVAALLQNKKELAEHDMLVDLGRNDLGKISKFGTVQVEKYREIKQFSHVSHIASRVSGEIDVQYDALDAIAATLPAGTLSGAPKKRAMEIIDEMERVRRGIYGGAIGYIDFSGNMDMCIGIRMAVHKNGNVYVQSGGGVVADSDPEMEYLETRRKAQAMMQALGNAQISDAEGEELL